MVRPRRQAVAWSPDGVPAELLVSGSESPIWRSRELSEEWLALHDLEVSGVQLWRWRAGPESRRDLAVRLWGRARGDGALAGVPSFPGGVARELLRASRPA